MKYNIILVLNPLGIALLGRTTISDSWVIARMTNRHWQLSLLLCSSLYYRRANVIVTPNAKRSLARNMCSYNGSAVILANSQGLRTICLNEELSRHWKSQDKGNVIIFLLKKIQYKESWIIYKEMPEGLVAVKRLLGKQNRTEGTFNSKHLNLYQNSNPFFPHIICFLSEMAPMEENDS